MSAGRNPSPPGRFRLGTSAEQGESAPGLPQAASGADPMNLKFRYQISIVSFFAPAWPQARSAVDWGGPSSAQTRMQDGPGHRRDYMHVLVSRGCELWEAPHGSWTAPFHDMYASHQVDTHAVRIWFVCEPSCSHFSRETQTSVYYLTLKQNTIAVHLKPGPMTTIAVALFQWATHHFGHVPSKHKLASSPSKSIWSFNLLLLSGHYLLSWIRLLRERTGSRKPQKRTKRMCVWWVHLAQMQRAGDLDAEAGVVKHRAPNLAGAVGAVVHGSLGVVGEGGTLERVAAGRIVPAPPIIFSKGLSQQVKAFFIRKWNKSWCEKGGEEEDGKVTRSEQGTSRVWVCVCIGKEDGPLTR